MLLEFVGGRGEGPRGGLSLLLEEVRRIGVSPSCAWQVFERAGLFIWELHEQLLAEGFSGKKTVEGETAAKIRLPLLCSCSTSRAFTTPALS